MNAAPGVPVQNMCHKLACLEAANCREERERGVAQEESLDKRAGSLGPENANYLTRTWWKMRVPVMLSPVRTAQHLAILLVYMQ